MKLFRAVVWIQGAYVLLNGVWPILHVESFMTVTGPKTDVWLVKTVGALLIPVSLCLLSYTTIRANLLPAAILGASTSVAFIVVDFYYALTGVISEIYMLDGFVEAGFLCCWAYLWFWRRDEWIKP